MVGSCAGPIFMNLNGVETMMFVFTIPEETYRPPKRSKVPLITESNYFEHDVEKLSVFRCPNCHEHALFRGCVFIGCVGCFNYFSEKEIIEENM
jgi:hypothetical protein